MLYILASQKFSTPLYPANHLFKITPLLHSPSQSPNFSSKYSNLHARKRNQRITPANFFPQREFRSESVRFESAPYKIPSGQLRSPSEIRNDPPSKNPPHFITSRRPPLSPPTFSSGEGGGWRFFTAPLPL